MTRTQYRRLCVFALRMVKLVPKHRRRACREHVAEILALTPERPLFGQRCGRTAKTHWIVFMKPTSTENRL